MTISTFPAGARAVVTGGTRGIGYAVAVALAEAGLEVVATGLTDAEIASFRNAEQLSATRLDVTDEAAVNALFASQPRLDVLVNCAGSGAGAGAEYELDSFARTLDINLTGTMRCAVAAKPLLERNGGAIVNVASMYSFFGGGHVPGYTASKGGVAQLTRALAVGWAKANIRVNAVAPGWIETDLTKAARADATRSEAIFARTPMARWGQPDEVASVVVFLSSHGARFMTGAIIAVDGGYSAA